MNYFISAPLGRMKVLEKDSPKQLNGKLVKKLMILFEGEWIHFQGH